MRRTFGVAEPFSARLFTRLGLVARPIASSIAYRFVMLEPDIGPTPDIVAGLTEDIKTTARDRLQAAPSHTHA